MQEHATKYFDHVSSLLSDAYEVSQGVTGRQDDGFMMTMAGAGTFDAAPATGS